MPIEKLDMLVWPKDEICVDFCLMELKNKINELIETVNFLKNELAVHHNTLMLLSMDLQELRK